MKAWQRNGILAVALVAFGAARMPFEHSLGKELRATGLVAEPMAVGTMEKIGQTSWAVGLGGLRTLVASFLNIRAFSFFQEQKWNDVMDTYNIIVSLAPKTRYYWDTGSWHSAYNAASYFLNDSELPALRRKQEWRSSIYRGRAFLERGIRNNPNDWNLLASLGFMLSDSNKFPAFRNPDETFAAAADAYGRAADTGNAPAYVRRASFFSLARVTGREKEALEIARNLYKDPANRVPTLLTLLLVLEAHENPDMDTTARAIEIFGSAENAYQALSNHWYRSRERFPVYGVAKTLESLERKLETPKEESIFSKPPPPPAGVDLWFEK